MVHGSVHIHMPASQPLPPNRDEKFPLEPPAPPAVAQAEPPPVPQEVHLDILPAPQEPQPEPQPEEGAGAVPQAHWCERLANGIGECCACVCLTPIIVVSATVGSVFECVGRIFCCERNTQVMTWGDICSGIRDWWRDR